MSSAEEIIRQRCRENAQLICDQSKGAFPHVGGMEDLLYSLVKGLQALQEREVSDEAIEKAAERYAENHEDDNHFSGFKIGVRWALAKIKEKK